MILSKRVSLLRFGFNKINIFRLVLLLFYKIGSISQVIHSAASGCFAYVVNKYVDKVLHDQLMVGSATYG